MFLIFRNNGKILRTVHQKTTHNKVYLQWDMITSETWKRGTFKTLLLRVPTISSEEPLLQKETEHL